MKYNRQDLDWTAFSDRIMIDERLNTDNLGWKHGDRFEFINQNGRQMLVKIESSKNLKGNDHG